MKPRPSSKKIANRVVVASSAAVLAVYAAGYTRTQTAADRFDEQTAGRRPVTQGAPQRETSRPAANPANDARVLEAVKPLVTSIKNAPAATAANAATVAEGPPPTLPIEPVPAPAQPTASAPAAEPAAPPVPAAEAKAAPPNPALPPWKDGKYEGWGSCRHGDIQAAVTIEGGRIVSATIAQCLTRYSCDIIDILPPQVAKKQSPNVDSVGGATQSADAFYYAVYDALAKAK